MTRYRKKPVVVDAVQIDLRHPNWNELREFFGCKSGSGVWRWRGVGQSVVITTLEGEMRADPGDWIIKGVAGEFYPCKPAIFAATYEEVDA